MTAYRIDMQAICRAERAQDIAEYLQVIPGFYEMAQPHKLDGERIRLHFSMVVREELQEGTLLETACERVEQYLQQRPDIQPVEVTAQTQERLADHEEAQLPPDYIPPRRSL